MNSILYRFRHGAGDALELGIVLKHLKHYRPELTVGVESPVGIHSLLNGCCNSHILRHPMDYRENYEERKHLQFLRPETTYEDYPSTKAARCLLNEIGLLPLEDLFRYEVNITQEAKDKVDKFVPNKPFAVLHYEGTSCKPDKDLLETEAAQLANQLLNEDFQVIVIDLDKTSELEGEGIVILDRDNELWYPEKRGDGQIITELITRAQVFYGIDSGPAHCAAATNTPSFVFWVNNHPGYCFSPADNVVHICSDELVGTDYMMENYNFWGYEGDIENFIEWLSECKLNELLQQARIESGNRNITKNEANQPLFTENVV